MKKKPNIKAELEDWGNWKIASITGDFTAQSLIEVRTLFDSIEKSMVPRVAIDLSNSNFLDSSAIQLMMNFYKKLSDRGGKLKILAPSDDAYDILKMLCVKELIEICISRDSFERTC